MLGSAIDEQRFQRREKIARGIVQAIMGLPVLSEFRAQFFHDRRGARHCCVAGLQPFEFSQKVIASQRRQSPQKILNPIGFWHGTQFLQFDWMSAIDPLRAGMFARMEPREAYRRKLRVIPARETTGMGVSQWRPKRSVELRRFDLSK
jgi:hypothetical protein